MKILLIYPPFCTPTIAPYSISHLKSIFIENKIFDVKCLDLNAKFHKLRFPNYYSRLNNEPYDKLFSEFNEYSKKVYSINNSLICKDHEPELLDQMIDFITSENPSHVAFSLVYNSQVFMTKAIIIKLKKLGIECIAGGPASEMLRDEVKLFSGGYSFLSYINEKLNASSIGSDFSDYDSHDYLSEAFIYPVKSSNGCPYGACSFCTHNKYSSYQEYPSLFIPEDASQVCFIDSMISTERIIKISHLLKKRNCYWWAQLRPTNDLISPIKTLAESKLKSVSWGVESGSQKILNRMRKGTRVEDIERVLYESKKAGIINTVFIMFGFPGETRDDFLQTIEFLKRNIANIDLVSTSIFGLQKGSEVYNNPKKYGIYDISENKRTILDSKISFKIHEGINSEDAKMLRKKYKKTIEGINKIPKIYNYVKEQTLLI